ncbi:HNH endonuclease family protein [Corynebacterium resistens]|uniref:HNH endonuclease family protein n=1 Tax=Corynebacterium resistens TaxID=258224 RepID=UPI0001E28707
MRTWSSSSQSHRPRFIQLRSRWPRVRHSYSRVIAAAAVAIVAGVSVAGCSADFGDSLAGGASSTSSSLTPPAGPTSGSAQATESSGRGDEQRPAHDKRAVGDGTSSPAPHPGAVQKRGGGRGGVGQKTSSSAETVRLRGVLATLEVKGRAPKNNYRRAEFGQRWKDVDRNGCDQRNDVLARDLQQVEAPKGCKVLRGVLQDPYTGQVIAFQRGQRTSSAVQIDHVVALADAWQKGAQQWTPEKRELFANDKQNLLAVDGPSNMQKGAGDAATWLPRNKAFRCRYVSIQIEVKAKYGLWVTSAERDAMDRELGRCT